MQRSGDEEAIGLLIQPSQDVDGSLRAGPGHCRPRVTSEQLQAAVRVTHAYAGRWAGQAARLNLPSSSTEGELNGPP